MFIAFARRCLSLVVLLIGSSPVSLALAAPSSPSTAVQTVIPNTARAVVFTGWMSSCNRYERMQKATVLTAAKPQVKAFTCNFAVGGSPVPFGVATTLTLTLDGTPVASAAIKPTDTSVTFDVDINAVPENWYRASITGLDGSWSVLDYSVYVLKGAVAKPHGVMPVTTASHELMFEGLGRYQHTWVPTKFEPVMVPYPARVFPPMSAVPARKNLVVTSLAVPRPDDLYRPALTKEGVWTTANIQNYFAGVLERPNPILPMLDGPRGRGSIIAPVHLEVGTAAPNGVLRGNIYFIESWRIGKVTPDGTVVTLAGYRHKDMASYYADPTSAELVGDWSSIPPERRGFVQPWGMAWDPRTLGINEMAAPIPTEGNEKPHVFGPTLYVSDTFRNRVLKIEYSATKHGVPPKITEFVTGLNEPWDVVAVGVRLYVSDRKNHAIKAFDMDSGALVASIPVAQPEGLALLDDWLYYGSILTKSIRKINLATGENVLIADPTVPAAKFGYFIDGNSNYMKIAVSDGSFGPRGMVAYTTWSNRNFGYPNLIDGTTGASIDFLSLKPGETSRETTPLGLSSYSTAVGIGAGRMLFGTAEEGLHVVSQALPTDPVIDAKAYKAGADQWQAAGLNLTHGAAGYGYYGLPLPWGVTPEIDYFLKANLHGGGLPAGGGAPPPTSAPNVAASASAAAFGNVTVGQAGAAKTVVISNTGTAAATNMVYPAAPAKFGKSGTCTGSTLNAGATCTIVFTYTPTSATTDSATYTVTGGGATMSILLSGTGTPAATASLSVSPTALAFGSVTVGQSSAARPVTITNTGSAVASGVALGNSNAAEFVVSGNTCGTSLAAGAACTLNVTYRPSGTGPDAANLTASFTGGSATQVAMSGTGAAPPTPNVSASPLALAFGNVTVGQTSGAQAIIVSNTGTGDATNMAYPAAPPNFNRSGTCSAGTLEAGASCTVVFTYSPTAATSASATYTITGGGRTMAIALSGTGTELASASLEATPSSLRFGSVAPGSSSTQQSITLTNNGGAAATGMSLTNTNATEFPVSGDTCGTTLDPGATCQLLVAYAPGGAGFDNASLTWTYGGGSFTVPMFGSSEDTSTPPPPPSTPPATTVGKLTIVGSLSLPNVALGLASPPSVVTITNSGNDAVWVTAIQSSNAGEFSISGSTCKSIAAGASCTFNVTFSPFYIGPRSATITVASNAPGTPPTLQVSGAGQSGALPLPPPPGAAAAVEYYHAGFDHYFITASADEIGKLDAGTFAGWIRTGKQFNVFAAPADGLRTACRFFSTAFGARSSHFYTPDAPECSTVRGNPDWQFEGDVFYTMPPDTDGNCAAAAKPVYRMYNNGQGGAPNHRYTTDPSVRALMLAQGWVAEGYGPIGVIMCSPQ